MAKILKATFPEKCIGCELCVMEVQRQLNKQGLDGAPIRIFKSSEDNSMFGSLTYEIHIDSKTNTLNINRVKDICPTAVFTIEDADKTAEDFLE